MRNKKNIVIGALTSLCLVLFITAVANAGAASKAKAELEEYEAMFIEWHDKVQETSLDSTPIDYNADIINEQNERIAELQQEQLDAYNASIEALNSYSSSYNALLLERDDLASKLAKSLTRLQTVKIVEVEKTIMITGKDWGSVTELEEFLAGDDTDNSTEFTGSIVLGSACEEKAFQLRDRAFKIGKRLEMEILTAPEFNRWYEGTIDSSRLHAVCKAVIGNEVWYIEPSDDRIWIGAYLD